MDDDLNPREAELVEKLIKETMELIRALLGIGEEEADSGEVGETT